MIKRSAFKPLVALSLPWRALEIVGFGRRPWWVVLRLVREFRTRQIHRVNLCLAIVRTAASRAFSVAWLCVAKEFRFRCQSLGS